VNPKLGIHLNLELGNKMTLELRNHLNFFTFYLGNNLVADTLSYFLNPNKKGQSMLEANW
jgi:hypothetical protein